MRHLFGLLLAFASGHGFAQSCEPSEPWITLEIVASEPAGDDPAEVVDIAANGCATVRYSRFDIRAGVYREALTPPEQAALRALLAAENASTIDADTIRREMNARDKMYRAKILVDGPEVFEVQCGDTYRLVVDGNPIYFYAPKEMARRHPTVRGLQSLVRVAERLQELGAAVRGRSVAVGR